MPPAETAAGIQWTIKIKLLYMQKLFLANGADTTFKDKDGMTPLQT